MLNFDSNGFYKLVGTCNPVDTTNKFCIFCEMELSRERGLDMNTALTSAKRKSTFWKVYFEAKFTPFKALSPATICEGSVINDLNTTQVA